MGQEAWIHCKISENKLKQSDYIIFTKSEETNSTDECGGESEMALLVADILASEEDL